MEVRGFQFLPCSKRDNVHVFHGRKGVGPMLIGSCFSYLDKRGDAIGVGRQASDGAIRETDGAIVYRMKIRDEMEAWREHLEKRDGVMANQDQRVDGCEAGALCVGEMLRKGAVDPVGEALVCDGVLVGEGVVCVFRFSDPPIGLEKGVKLWEKGERGGAFQGAPFGTGLRVDVDPFANRGEEKKGKNVGSCSHVHSCLHVGERWCALLKQISCAYQNL